MKNSKNGKTIIYIIGFLALVFIGIFTYGYLHSQTEPGSENRPIINTEKLIF